MANAQDTTASPTSTTSQSTQGPADGQRGNHLTTVLADALGMDAETVRQALSEIRDERRTSTSDTGGAPTPPSEADRTAREQEMAAALAEKLGVDPGAITDAIAEAHAKQEQERAAALTARLDKAVAAGTLTEADATSVRKAVESGVVSAGGPKGSGGPRGTGGLDAPGEAAEN
ncbi:hypothetical protein [Dietzia psychralcaliphila]|uniref:hypothetical protein n=1 Tax=Dietzia psychralcaliphila TaxID=139021 RepID=UPI000D47E974|nr:hypothetical protein [Dietzia psychralcaliphila]PTM85281.1 hypothetical protein C8N39_11224 [Dietzia psychralcaliphila]